MTIKQTISDYIAQQPKDTRLRATSLWWDLFHYKISKQSVTRALGELAKEGIVEKATWTGGRNSEWRVL